MIPPPTSDRPHWDRLRRDKRSAAAVMLCVAAVMLPTLAMTTFSVTDVEPDGRTNPLYWLLLFPPLHWARKLMDYEPWAVRLMRPAFTAGPLFGLIAVGWSWTLWLYMPAFWFAPAGALLCSVVGYLLHRGSLVDLEGPRRLT